MKSIQLWPSPETSSTVIVQIVPIEGGAGLVLVNAAITNTQPTGWNGWVVLKPGDYINVQAQNGGLEVAISGTVLTGVAAIPPAAPGELRSQGPPTNAGPPAPDPVFVHLT